MVLWRVFLALDHLHTACEIGHTGWFPTKSIPSLRRTNPPFQTSRPTVSCLASTMIRYSATLKKKSSSALSSDKKSVRKGEQSVCPGISSYQGRASAFM
ncbi:hypothetical protein BJX68DRAFT_229755 [Aspergillus pseudodeflectus]|uniref:Secreted protein n=1 Tax=Aspergillus pseudodeflectus TaxID=176178 RepID=A0ABR4L093_9EURO